MAEPALPRPRPCASCPYRRDVPSGLWHEEEYAKLPGYDGDIPEQTIYAAFFCHQQDGSLCSGWLGHREPYDMLAVRLGISTDRLDPVCLDYTTDVPLFASGAEAAEHGRAGIASPDEKAQAAIDKIQRTRRVRGS